MAARTPNTPTLQVQNEPPIAPLVPSVDESSEAPGDDNHRTPADGGDE